MHYLKTLALSCLIFLAGNQFAHAQLNMEEIGSLQFYNSSNQYSGLSDIWGYVDKTGNEYALVGLIYGTAVVDVTEPANPVNLYQIPGNYSIWRDLKTYNNYAYVVDDQAGEGLLIIDLNNAPNNFSHVYWKNFSAFGSDYTLSTCHNLFIDEQGYAYLFGCNTFANGAIVLDLNQNPTNPPVVGYYNQEYIHDGYVRNDTLWAAQINKGTLACVYMGNKQNAQVLGEVETSGNFAHNCWLSDNGKYVFTTDEIPSGFIDAYDVSDLNDMKLIDKVQSSPGQNVIPHNVFAKGDYLVTAYYRDGITIHDATFPDNIIEVAHYDTSPLYQGDGYNGAWGVYPYLPSGNIIASDIEEGLRILSPTYTKAANVIVEVRAAFDNAPVQNVNVSFSLNEIELQQKNTDVLGLVKTGFLEEGDFTITVSKAGYTTASQTVTLSKNLQKKVTFVIDNPDAFSSNIRVVNEKYEAIPQADVWVYNNKNTYTVKTNENGIANIHFEAEGVYTAVYGSWGYQTTAQDAVLFDKNSGEAVFVLEEGYYDDFIFNNNWTISGDAESGIWERAVPTPTYYNNTLFNPDEDISDDYGTECYVTGNSGEQAGADDVDNGRTVLRSPPMDISDYEVPELSCYTWFANGGGQGSPPNDYLHLSLTNLSDTVLLYNSSEAADAQSQWLKHTYLIEGMIDKSAGPWYFIAEAADQDPGHLVDAGIDGFSLIDVAVIGISDINAPTSVIKAYPNPVAEHLFIESAEAAEYFFSVYSAEGKLLASQAFVQNLSFDTQNLPVGIYFYTIQDAKTKTMHYNSFVKK
ncbi:MAG: choice-of-anchor B family protein [Chitinophagales bacterium]|nr:choice-of-anchor B family protein [Bacteroidota bacterium]MCB9043272.1 choice-of-anchor B family protein [Chitinophagales bacterium]